MDQLKQDSYGQTPTAGHVYLEMLPESITKLAVFWHKTHPNYLTNGDKTMFSVNMLINELVLLTGLTKLPVFDQCLK